ncbi:MAG: outer membrane protein assembly factor BamD [Bacteroidetes bacterium]|nr:outer membrane protein assembly factor BamD [Bacteroidota bacterium]
MFQKTAIFSLIVLTLALGSCKSTYQKLLKSTDQDAKYEAAMDYYEKKDYVKALELFDLLQAVYRGTAKGEEVSYRSAYCYYNLKDFIVAGYYFKRHAQTYPLSERAEECMFMNAYCFYLDSPRYSLDQSNTNEAIKELQAFIDMYPRSTRVSEANQLVDNLRAKLEAKDYNIAILFYRMGDFMAAITSFENVLKRFPDTDRREEIYHYMTLAYYEFAEKSIPSKKRERYESAIEAYNNLLFQYPESKYLKDLATVQEKSRLKLAN